MLFAKRKNYLDRGARFERILRSGIGDKGLTGGDLERSKWYYVRPNKMEWH